MTSRAVLTLVGALVTVTVSAQTTQPPKPVKPEPPNDRTVITLPNLERHNPKNPYGGAFSVMPKPLPGVEFKARPQTYAVTVLPPKVDLYVEPQPFMRSDQKPRVVCGMTLIPADPSIDPGIVVKVPDLQTRYAIRAIK